MRPDLSWLVTTVLRFLFYTSARIFPATRFAVTRSRCQLPGDVGDLADRNSTWPIAYKGKQTTNYRHSTTKLLMSFRPMSFRPNLAAASNGARSRCRSKMGPDSGPSTQQMPNKRSRAVKCWACNLQHSSYQVWHRADHGAWGTESTERTEEITYAYSVRSAVLGF